MAAASMKVEKPSSGEGNRHGKRESFNNCGQMITEMASRMVKTFTENRHMMMIKNRGPNQHQAHPNNQTHDHEERAAVCHGSACTWKPSSGGTADTKNKDKQGGTGTKKEQNPAKKKKKKRSKNDHNSSDSSDNES